MKKTLAFLLLLAIIIMPANAVEKENVKPVKNVILLIPDGTSLATISIARWLQWYQDPSKPKLNIDPYLCGTVRTHSSNAPIGDSAPTTSCYMTGQPSRTGYVSTYPENDGDNDIYPTDPARAFQPLTTVLEAGKMLQGKATGLVFTCEFPHATPADCSAHSYNRGKYDWIAPQMVHNDINVVIGGGVSILTKDMEDYLLANGYGVYRNDLKGMRADNNQKMWALYGNKEMAYDIDRNPEEQPSIEEMTRKAIDKLSKNPNGFFLMVEGGKIDWACHGNDAATVFNEVKDMDDAIKVAYEFYKKHPKETLIVVTADHETGGIVLGTGKYALNLKALQYQKHSADGLSKRISELRKAKSNKVTWEDMKEFLGEEMGFWKQFPISWEQEKKLRDEFEQSFVRNKVVFAESMYSKSEPMAARAKEVMDQISMVGWVSGGHSAGYVPVFAIGAGSQLFGEKIDNTEIPKRIAKAAGYK